MIWLTMLYVVLCMKLEASKSEGLASDYSDGGAFLAGHEEQMRRIGKWKAFRTPERVASVSRRDT